MRSPARGCGEEASIGPGGGARQPRCSRHPAVGGEEGTARRPPARHRPPARSAEPQAGHCVGPDGAASPPRPANLAPPQPQPVNPARTSAPALPVSPPCRYRGKKMAGAISGLGGPEQSADGPNIARFGIAPRPRTSLLLRLEARGSPQERERAV